MTERQSNGSREGSFENRMYRWWFMVVVFAVIEAVLLIKLVFSDSPSSALFFAIILIAGLLFLTGAQSFGIVGLSLGTGGLQAQIQEVEDKVDIANERINALFLLTMSPWAYRHLRRLARPGGYGQYEISHGLSRELQHLVNIGYIEVPSFEEIPPRGENLSEFVTITDTGEEFLKLRQELED